MTLFGSGICCGTCEHWNSDFRGDTWCTEQGAGVSPQPTYLCREWNPNKAVKLIIPYRLKEMIKNDNK